MTKITLNPEQQKAVKHQKGPLLVVAGAGTGKTRVITERIKTLIQQQKTDPQNVLAVTFTEKASQEMLERLDEVMPLGYTEPWVYTFHSFCDRILRTEGLEMGLDSGYKIMSYPEQWLLFRQNLFTFDLKYFLPFGNPTKFISAILKFISRLQDENISVEEFRTFANSLSKEDDQKERFLELAHIYSHYTNLKLKESKLDFGDLIIYTIRLFKSRPNILNKYKKQFEHVLVDEFQDTNYSQYELIKILCPAAELSQERRSLLAVGDDSQSIYKFRGAAVSNILEFRDDYKEAEMVTLLKNYRSSQKILDPAYNLITNNNPDTLEVKLGISKELKSMVDAQNTLPAPQIVQATTLEQEVDFVVKKILEVLGREPEYTYKDVAILARANNHLDPFVFGLRQHGIPYQLVGNRGLYDREEVRDILALLRVIVTPQDSINLYRVLNIDCFDIDPNVISKLLSDARFKKTSFWDVVESSSNVNIKAAVKILNDFKQKITDQTPSEFVHGLVDMVGYVKSLIKEETIENQLSVNNLNLFLEKVKRFEAEYKADTHEIPTIIEFLDYLELMIEAGENPAQAEIEDIDTVNLLTVHASKGLEFKVVFIVNLVSGRFPTRNRKDVIEIPDALIKESLPSGDVHIQEERRLFYVGITRAQKHLYLTAAKNYGGKREKALSGYLKELDLQIKELEKHETNQTQESLFGVGSGYRSPKAVMAGPHNPYSLSYSKIATYQTCPLQYKYRYVLNLPTMPNAALSFGITVHNTLRDFHGKQALGLDVPFDELVEMYKNNWEPLGYTSSEHRVARFEDGVKLLKRYYDSNNTQKVKPLVLEKSFNLKIGGIKFFGRIDRIDPLPGGGVEIVDYKTGSTKDQKTVDNDSQVAFYAIAAKEALNMDPKKLTYYYVEDDVKISTTRTSEQLKEVKAEVEDVVGEMKQGNFEPKSGMHCNWCDYKEVCPFAFKG